MAKKKAEAAIEETGPDSTVIYDTIVVGAGSSGLAAAAAGEGSVLVLEASDRMGGRGETGLRLVSSVSPVIPSYASSAVLGSALVRWDRQWVESSEVDWDDKDWSAVLPQWKPLLSQGWTAVNGFQKPEGNYEVVLSSPVTQLRKVTEGDENGLWKLNTPGREWTAAKVVWAAGITALQNALGKHEAQVYLGANSAYDMNAADYRGGMSLTVRFTEKPKVTAPEGHLWALPLRHGGKLSLLFVALVPLTDGGAELRVLTHTARELNVEPGDVLSYQKAIRRGVKALFEENDPAANWSPAQEHWFVSDRVSGHVLGASGLLRSVPSEGLVFVGDESLDEQGDNDLTQEQSASA